MSRLDAAAFETLYDLLAAAIDRVGPEREADFLARLALLLMHAEVDEVAIRAALAAAEASVSDAT